MKHATPFSNPELIMVMAVAGFTFGLAYFAAVRRTIALFVAGRGWLRPAALTLGRIAAAVIFLAIAAKLGASSLLSAFIGFLLARAMAIRAARRAG